MRGAKNPKEYFPQITSDLRKAFGDDLISIILYGSAAGGDYIHGKSDLNLLVIVTDAGIERLERAIPFVKYWSKRRAATPLIMTKAFISSSLDSYPMEFLEMKSNHAAIWGEDVLAEIAIDPACLRLQMEREIKGKALHLRRRYLETGGKPRPLRQLIAESITAFVSIFKVLLYLKGIDAPAGKREVVRAAAQAFAIDPHVFLKCIDIREGSGTSSTAEVPSIFHAYLDEVTRLSEAVDAMQL